MATATKKKTEENAIETPKKNPVDHKKVKKNDIMAFIYYGKVDQVMNGGRDLALIGLDKAPEQFNVHGLPLVEASASADQFQEETTVTMTKAAELLINAYNRPFTVCFTKQEGDERILRGRLIQPEPLLGRSLVEDLDIDKDKHRPRLVDHRTIKWLILDGVKYTVKTK